MPMAWGKLVFFGSGEISPTAGRVYDSLAREGGTNLRIAILETPAGFELNSAQVAGRVAAFFQTKLADRRSAIEVLPARRKGTAESPDNEVILRPILSADWIFLGPGSPTYAVRQLKDSLAWEYILAAWQQGAHLILASAAAIAAGACSLPVYEIFKAGEDPHWKPGLDLLGPLGMRLAIVPHWNNTEGGADLDTSRAFVGSARFEALAAELPGEMGILGIDEYTAVVVDLKADTLRVEGAGGATIRYLGREQRWAAGAEFPLSAVGKCVAPPVPFGVRASTWEAVRSMRLETAKEPAPPPEVADLLRERDAARSRKDFRQADSIRLRMEALGWTVEDTPQGSSLRKK
jgi:cyanophycinase-like exopeptidase